MKKIKKLLFGALVPLMLSCNIASPEKISWYKKVISPIPIEVVEGNQREIFGEDQILIPKIRTAQTTLGMGLEFGNWQDISIPKEENLQELYLEHLGNIANYFYNTTNKSQKIKNSLDKLTYGYIASNSAAGVLQNKSIMWLNINQDISENPYIYPFFCYEGTFFHEATHLFTHDWGLEQKGSKASNEILDKNNLEKRLNEEDPSCKENFEHLNYFHIFQMQGYSEAFGISNQEYIDHQEPIAHVASDIMYSAKNHILCNTKCIPEEFMFYFSDVLEQKGDNFVIDLKYNVDRICLEFNQKGQAIKRIIQEESSLSTVLMDYDEENYCTYSERYRYPNADTYWNSGENDSLGDLDSAVYESFDKNNFRKKADIYAVDYSHDELWDYIYINEYENGEYYSNHLIYPQHTIGREISPEELKQILAADDFSILDPEYYSGTSTSRIMSEPYANPQVDNYAHNDDYNMLDIID